MANDLILIQGDVPAHIVEAGLARQLNSDAIFGISTGFPPSIRVKNGKFRLVDGSGEETVIAAKDLVESQFLPVVIIGCKKELSKSYYAKPYDPNQDEPSAPDCYSLDAVAPSADAKNPQCANCVSCPHNQFGSGRNAAGQPTKGKACTDTKILAAFYKGGIYSLKVPPASLKNWGAYVRALDTRNIPLGHVVTFVSFAEDVDYSVLVFQAGRYIPAESLPAIAEKASSLEVREIICPVGYAPKAQAAPAPQAAPAKSAAAAAPAPAPAAKPAPKKPEVVKPAPAPAPVVEPEVVEAAPQTLPGDDVVSQLLDL